MGWLKSEKYKGHKVFFFKDADDGWVDYYIDSKKNLTGEAENKDVAFRIAKIGINRGEA